MKSKAHSKVDGGGERRFKERETELVNLESEKVNTLGLPGSAGSFFEIFGQVFEKSHAFPSHASFLQKCSVLMHEP